MSLEDLQRDIERMKAIADDFRRSWESMDLRILVNKKTHRIRFEGETEEQVTVIIEKREVGGKDTEGKT